MRYRARTTLWAVLLLLSLGFSVWWTLAGSTPGLAIGKARTVLEFALDELWFTPEGALVGTQKQGRCIQVRYWAKPLDSALPVTLVIAFTDERPQASFPAEGDASLSHTACELAGAAPPPHSFNPSATLLAYAVQENSDLSTGSTDVEPGQSGPLRGAARLEVLALDYSARTARAGPCKPCLSPVEWFFFVTDRKLFARIPGIPESAPLRVWDVKADTEEDFKNSPLQPWLLAGRSGEFVVLQDETGSLILRFRITSDTVEIKKKSLWPGVASMNLAVAPDGRVALAQPLAAHVSASFRPFAKGHQDLTFGGGWTPFEAIVGVNQITYFDQQGLILAGGFEGLRYLHFLKGLSEVRGLSQGTVLRLAVFDRSIAFSLQGATKIGQLEQVLIHRRDLAAGLGIFASFATLIGLIISIIQDRRTPGQPSASGPTTDARKPIGFHPPVDHG